MPSSSNRNTHLERTLIAHFRCVYTHLYISGAALYLDRVTIGFANTLDMNQRNFQCAITFSVQPHLPEPQRSQSREVAAIMHSMGIQSQKMALCQRLYEAGAACDEMGTLLIENRREEEGQFWRRWGIQLMSAAEEANLRGMSPVVEARPVKADEVSPKRPREVDEDEDEGGVEKKTKLVIRPAGPPSDKADGDTEL